MSSNHHASKSFTLLFSFLMAFFILAVGVFFYYILSPKGNTQTLSSLFPNSASGQESRPAITPDNPKTLRIPSIGVNAKVQSVGVTANGQMGIPTNFTDVAWFNKGPKPGELGSAVIDGHLDTARDANAVFMNLSKVKIGDLIFIDDVSGQTLKFKVTETAVYDINNAPIDRIFDYKTPTSKLNIITCDGIWNQKERNYNQRLVVYSELVN